MLSITKARCTYTAGGALGCPAAGPAAAAMREGFRDVSLPANASQLSNVLKNRQAHFRSFAANLEALFKQETIGSERLVSQQFDNFELQYKQQYSEMSNAFEANNKRLEELFGRMQQDIANNPKNKEAIIDRYEKQWNTMQANQNEQWKKMFAGFQERNKNLLTNFVAGYQKRMDAVNDRITTHYANRGAAFFNPQ